MQLQAKNAAILKGKITCVGKYDQLTMEMKGVTTQKFGRKVWKRKRQGEVAVNYRLKVSIYRKG